MTAPVVLVLGFEPFDGESLNPSAQIARCLDGETIGRHRLVGAILPVAFGDAPIALAQHLDRHQPGFVFALGLAGGRAEIALERVAINLIDARIADNAGLQPIDTPVLKDGPGAYFSSLPLKTMQARVQSLGIPCVLSLSAGTFVCNQVFYWLGHLLATEHPGACGGFIHLPWLPEQAARNASNASLPLESMLLGVRTAIDCALHDPLAPKNTGGTLY
jgi:pyroglutamyl-peptidase